MLKKIPEFLYHGTSKIYLSRILAKGLMDMNKTFVYMTPNINIAKSYALRRSTSRKYPYNKIINDKCKNDPVIIKINAIEAFNNKVIFTRKNNEIYISKFIDKRYLEVVNL